MNNKTEFYIDNIKCASCVNKIEKSLLRLPEIDYFKINLLDKTILIKYKSKKDDSLIIKNLAKIGYTANVNKIEELNPQYFFNIVLPIIAGICFMLFGMNSYTTFSQGLIQSIISLIILFIAARKSFLKGFLGFRYLDPNMYSLTTLGILSAWLYSSLVVLFRNYLPQGHLYFESSLIIVGLLNLGNYFEDKCKSNASNSIKTLLQLQPNTCTVIRNSQEELIDTETVSIDDVIKVKPGEMIPLDGIIIEGCSYIDESMLTGEAIPVYKTIGSQVIGGTINTTGAFNFRVTNIGNSTVLAEIISLVKNAQMSKPRLAKLANKITKIFVPTIILIALISGLTWYIYTNSFSNSITIFMNVLIIACPCSIGLAIPASLVVGLGRSTKYGILIRNAEVIESITKLDYVLFDKTGTLTEGKPRLINIESTIEPEIALKIAKTLEQNSEHPLAKAILEFDQKIAPYNDIKEFESITGSGITCIVNAQKYYLGNLSWIKSIVPNINNLVVENNATNVYLTNQDEIIARLDISDTIKQDSKETINKLSRLGIKTAVLTGDQESVAKSVTQELGLGEVYFGLKPQDKINVVKQFQKNGLTVAFVGDGINDSPSLSQADVGIAIGNGTDIAIQSADIILMHSSLLSILNMIKIGSAINKNIKQNLFGAFIYNLFAIIIATGVFYPLWHILLNPIIASIAMSLSSITVLLNANRLSKL